MTHEEIVKPAQFDVMKAPAYMCPELNRNPGIDDDRFKAFELPSRVGRWLFYPDGRKELI